MDTHHSRSLKGFCSIIEQAPSSIPQDGMRAKRSGAGGSSGLAQITLLYTHGQFSFACRKVGLFQWLLGTVIGVS